MTRAADESRGRSEEAPHVPLRTLAHEMRASLSAVLASARMLERSLADRPEQLHLVRVVRANGRHLRALVDNFLDFASLESGQLGIHRQPCDPTELAAEALVLLQAAAVEKGLVLRGACEGPVPSEIQTDPVRAKQILTNMIDNAVKFTPSGRVELTLRFERVPEGREREQGDCAGWLRFEVVDTGPGLDAEQCGRIFEPFYQAHEDRGDGRRGTGLGLAICQRLAWHLGGDLSVASRVGEGSVFTLVLPVERIEGVEMTSRMRPIPTIGAAGARPHPPGEKARLSGVDVLLIAPRRDQQLLIGTVLKGAGASVRIIGDVSMVNAKRSAPLASTDVLLLGWDRRNLPLIEPAALREMGYAGPIIAIPSDPYADAPSVGGEEGYADYLPSPLSAASLIDTVQRHAAR